MRLGRSLSGRRFAKEIYRRGGMADQLSDDRSIRSLDLLDNFNREGLGNKVDFSLPAERVVRSLDQIIDWHGKPQTIPVDNDPEYVSEKLMA